MNTTCAGLIRRAAARGNHSARSTSGKSRMVPERGGHSIVNGVAAHAGCVVVALGGPCRHELAAGLLDGAGPFVSGRGWVRTSDLSRVRRRCDCTPGPSNPHRSAHSKPQGHQLTSGDTHRLWPIAPGYGHPVPVGAEARSDGLRGRPDGLTSAAPSPDGPSSRRCITGSATGSRSRSWPSRW
jgi:hypothetical protein